MQIDDTNLGAAMDLLATGFPGRSRAFWEQGLARLRQLNAHACENAPVGYLLMSKGRTVGVGLTSVNHRSRHLSAVSSRSVPLASHGNVSPAAATEFTQPEPRTCINLASWYVEEAERWKIPLLLRELMHDKSAVYTDLTPTPEVRPILKALGFEPINNGVKVINTAMRALRFGDNVDVRVWDAASQSGSDDGLTAIMQDHIAMGCLGYSIQTRAGACVVLVKPGRIKFANAVQLVFCTNNAILENALPALSRVLIRQGFLALVMDIAPGQTETSSVSQIALPNRRQRFIKNGRMSGETDYTYSELALFDL